MNNPDQLQIEREIESKRAVLNQSANLSNLLDPKVIDQSQELDDLIVKQMKLKKGLQKK